MLKLSFIDFSDCLKAEVRCLDVEPSLLAHSEKDKKDFKHKSKGKITTVMHETDSQGDPKSVVASKAALSNQPQGKTKIYCPYCESEHYLSQCESLVKLTKREKVDWIKTKRR